MRYEDRITIATPEGVDLDLVLAGLGSRIGAGAIDLVLRLLIILGFALLLLLPSVIGGTAPSPLLLAMLGLVGFGVQFAYDVGFETFASGRTPGKRWTGLRVVRSGGGPVDFRTSAIRNLLRLVDGLLTAYVGGIVSIVVSSRNQRIGDMAAGTLVVREGFGGSSRGADRPLHELWRPENLDSWDVSGVTSEEVGAVRRFLVRRSDIEPASRARIAAELGSRLRPKVVGPHEGVDPEAFLEALVVAKEGRGRP